MKTTVEIADPLLRKARKLAKDRKTTLREVLETALRREIAEAARARKPFRLKRATFRGEGLQPGVDLSNWDQVRSIVYDGRGE
jgi:hypothetical protein